jgi:hypothetical protein
MAAAPAPLQLEVERFYTTRGYLLPSFHTYYWFGLRVPAGSGVGAFSWLDLTVNASTAAGAYRNWGILTLSNMQMLPEPNNFVVPPELCAGCNVTQARQGAWGWTDWSCGAQYPAMCRITGGPGLLA